MKIQFKHQKFQADAAKAVVDVFAGQPYLTPTFMMDKAGDIFRRVWRMIWIIRDGAIRRLFLN